MLWLALALYVVWTLATYLLEGLPRTLLRPEAVSLRLAYTLVANVVVGLAGSALLLRGLVRSGRLPPEVAGFGSLRRSAIAIVLGVALGSALYVGQGAPSLHAVVVLNAFAQVLPVSAAEAVVCWSVIAGVVTTALRGRGLLVSRGVAALVASVLFGIYHVAHSPPFNEPGMIGALSVVGLATSLFFFVSRDVFGTLAFHNFLALFGVVRALAAAGKLAEYEQVQTPLPVVAAATIALLAVIRGTVRSAGDTREPEPGEVRADRP